MAKKKSKQAAIADLVLNLKSNAMAKEKKESKPDSRTNPEEWIKAESLFTHEELQDDVPSTFISSLEYF